MFKLIYSSNSGLVSLSMRNEKKKNSYNFVRNFNVLASDIQFYISEIVEKRPHLIINTVNMISQSRSGISHTN